MGALGSAFRQTAKLFGAHRKLWVPFLLVAVVQAIGLLLVWLAPQEPFSKLLAPPIRYFFSDRVLHYPTHLWFLFHVMRHTQLIASTLIGAFLSGVACVMVRQTYAGQPSMRDALASRDARYWTLMII